MKRRALLFGNTGGLNGVKVDLDNYCKFLLSDTGGQWYEDEITILMNPTRNLLLSTITALKFQQPDYVIVIFSGHGAYSRGTVLELNSNGDCVNEAELRNIAPRQLLIFDCCRNVIVESALEQKTSARSAFLGDLSSPIRQMYNIRIMQSIEQQSSLYACSIGESSYDTNKGGVYSISFLSSLTPEYNQRFKLVSSAQEEASPKTTSLAWALYSRRQVPDQTIPRCLASQQLIISINPRDIVL